MWGVASSTNFPGDLLMSQNIHLTVPGHESCKNDPWASAAFAVEKRPAHTFLSLSCQLQRDWLLLNQVNALKLLRAHVQECTCSPPVVIVRSLITVVNRSLFCFFRKKPEVVSDTWSGSAALQCFPSVGMNGFISFIVSVRFPSNVTDQNALMGR